MWPQDGRVADDQGASTVEYALIMTLVALFVIGALTALGGLVVGLYAVPF